VVSKGGDRPRKRFSRAGNTSHGPRHAAAPTAPNPAYPPPHAIPPGYLPTQPGSAPQYPAAQFAAPQYPPSQYPPQSGPAPFGPAPFGPAPFGQPTYHHVLRPSQQRIDDDRQPASPAVAMTKAAVTGTNRAARLITRKVILASKADGAHESGLTALIWNQVLSYGSDAMITVALAGTVFFGASAHAQRGNVLLYLLVTMAPFALVAPFIGPALDRFQHGRRWTMAGTAVGRAILALIMASHSTDLLVLYPCALGSLVLSKAYVVVRAAAAPRLVPPGLSLTEANARMSIFGLGSTLVGGGLVGLVIKVTGSYTTGLVLTAIAFGVCAFFAFRLPPQVDSAVTAAPHRQEPRRPAKQPGVPPFVRLRGWARRGFDERVVLALQGECALRFMSGLLTIFMAFYVEATAHGATAAAQLGAVIGAMGAGNMSGTALGTRIKVARPELVIVIGALGSAVTCLLAALLFSITVAVVAVYLGAVANSLSKIALDALIQRDVDEMLRSSAFARSETFLQLAWVFGATTGVVLPAQHPGQGALGFWVAGAVVGAVATVIVLRDRVMRRTAQHGETMHEWPQQPGSVAPRPTDS
jgi:MFS family permease